MNKSVFVLGGAGFLGKALTSELLLSGFKDVYSGDIVNSNVKNVRDIRVNVLNFEELKSACQGKDIIINCTGQITKPIKNCAELNSSGIQNICSCVKDTNSHLIHISSVNIYGTISGDATETTRLNPEDPYATCKAIAEFIIERSLDFNRYSVLRLSNLYGASQMKGIFSYLIQSYSENTTLEFNNDGSLSRHYLHKSDAVGLICGFTKEGPFPGAYNVIGPDKLSITEIIDMCNSISGKAPAVYYSPNPPSGNISKLSDDLLRQKIEVSFSHNVSDYLKVNLVK